MSMRARVCVSWASSWVMQAIKVFRSVMAVSHLSTRSSFSVARAVYQSVRFSLECSVQARLIAFS
jgi:hypothetical protein